MSSRCRILIIAPMAAGRHGKNSLIKVIGATLLTPLCMCARVCVLVCERSCQLLINKMSRCILGARKKEEIYFPN